MVALGCFNIEDDYAAFAPSSCLIFFVVSWQAFPFPAVGILVFAVFRVITVFLVLAVFRTFITLFTHQASARSVIFNILVGFESKVWMMSMLQARCCSKDVRMSALPQTLLPLHV